MFAVNEDKVTVHQDDLLPVALTLDPATPASQNGATCLDDDVY
jgi:hypothetical protein